MAWDTRTGGGTATRTQQSNEVAILNYVDSVAPSLVPVAVASGDATGATDTAALNAAIAAAKAAGGGTVLAKPGQTYQVASSGTTSLQLPSGGRFSYDRALLLPSNVTLDMNGSTLQLRGSSECELIMNEAGVGVGATLSAGLSTTGGAITTLPVNATNIAIPSGSQLVANTIGANGKRQVFTTSALANVGATSISITSTTPTFAFPSGTGIVVRDSNIGLLNAILDLRSVAFTGHNGLTIAYADRPMIRNVMIKNGVVGYGWLFDIDKGDFDNLGSDSMIGEGWFIGEPHDTGLNHNGVYNSTFGRIYGRNITAFDNASQPGNPFVVALYDCTIESIYAKDCDGGFKLELPSTAVGIGVALVENIGNPTNLEGGFKIQGDATGTFPAPTDRPTNINVGVVIARNCAGPGLYMYHARDCSVGTYIGYKNCKYQWAESDVVLDGGINDYVGHIHSDLSNGGGVRLSNDSAGAGPAGFELPSIKVRNPGQLGSTLRTALTTGGAITSLPVAATSFPLPSSGFSVIVTNGTQSQTFTTTAAIAIGATSIPVTSLTPNSAYAIGSKVIVALIREGVRLDTPATGRFGTIDVVDDQAIHTMNYLLQDTTTTSVAPIESLTGSGFTAAKASIGSAGVGTINISDTSGATLANVEIEVNKLKAIARARGEWI